MSRRSPGSPPGILQNGPTETPLSLEVLAGSPLPRQRHLQRSSFQSIFLHCRNSCRQLWKPLLKVGGNKDRERAGFQNMSLNGVQDSLELQQELCGHTDRVWSVAWSPAGDMLASCSGDKTVRIWAKAANSETWACTAVLEGGHTRTVRACSWSPDGQCLATASFDATVVIWQREGNDFENVAILEGHENEVKCVAWSPSGTLIATCSRDKSVWIWECEPGHEYFCLDVKHGHSQDVKSVCWHPSGELLVSCSYDDSIRLWTDDGGEWICTQTLEGAGVGHSSTVWAVAFSPDGGSKMISCSDDSTLRIWECHFATGFREPKFKHLATISGHHDRAIYSVDWSQDGLIATGSQDNSISIFGVSERMGPQAELGSNLSTELVMQKPQAHEADVNCVRWHPKQDHLLASASDDNCIRLWSYMGGADT